MARQVQRYYNKGWKWIEFDSFKFVDYKIHMILIKSEYYLKSRKYLEASVYDYQQVITLRALQLQDTELIQYCYTIMNKN